MNPTTDVDGSIYPFVVPVLLLVIMICMGMELVRDDFRRIRAQPRPVLVGLLGQLVLLPLAGLLFAQWSGFSAEIAIGIVIIAACPGGTTSNIFSYLARANLALSVSLTALSSMLCFVAIPVWLNLAISIHGADLELGPTSVQLPFGATVAQLFVVTLLPVLIGMALRARWPQWSNRVRAPLRSFTAALMGGAIVLILGSEWENLVEHFESASLAALVLVTATLTMGYGIARAGRLDERDSFTISIEVGLQNGALATMIVVTVLERAELIVFPGTYVVLSLVPVSIWTLIMRRRFR